MHGRNEEADLAAFNAILMSGNDVAAAQFARSVGIKSEKFERRVSGGLDKFGRDIMTTYGDELIARAAHFDREKAASEEARDECVAAGITDPVVFEKKYKAKLALAGLR